MEPGPATTSYDTDTTVGAARRPQPAKRGFRSGSGKHYSDVMVLACERASVRAWELGSVGASERGKEQARRRLLQSNRCALSASFPLALAYKTDPRPRLITARPSACARAARPGCASKCAEMGRHNAVELSQLISAQHSD